jgi:HEAT repeat protein
MGWLIAHPDLARAPVAAIVREEGNGGVVRARALAVLGEIGDPGDVPLLDDALRDGGEVGAWDAAKALAAHRSSEAFEALVATSGAIDDHVAAAATAALGWRRDQRARPTLEALLDHASADVRYQAVGSLIDLGAKPSRTALRARRRVEQDRDVRAAIRKALAR